MSKKDKKEKAQRRQEKSLRKKREALAGNGVLAQSVFQAARSMRTVLSRHLAESGLYAGQDGVILALAETDGLTTGHLAQILGVKAPTMTRTVTRMEAQGFVVRREDADDGRLSKVHLTEAGRGVVEAISASVAACDRLAAEGLSGKEVKTLIRLLRAVDANLGAGPNDGEAVSGEAGTGGEGQGASNSAS